MSSTNHSQSPLARATVALTMIALAIIVGPQLLLGAQNEPIDTYVVFLSEIGGVILGVLVMGVLHWTNQLTPRTTSQKIVATYLGTAAGIVVSSAQFLAYTVLSVLGASLAASGLASTLSIDAARPLMTVGILFVAAIPALLGKSVPWRVHIGAVAIAMIVVLAVLGTGMAREAISATPYNDVVSGESRTWSSAIQSLSAATFPVAVMFLTAERPIKDSVYRRTSSQRLLQLMIPTFVVISVMVYFIVTVGMDGRWHDVPLLIFAEVFFGTWGSYVASVALLLTGLAAAAIGFWCLPRLLRELAIDHVLPRSFASRDARRPRQIIVVGTLILGALLSTYSSRNDTGGIIFVHITNVIFVLFCLGMAFRGHAILGESMDKEDRRRARASQWGFLAFALLGAAGGVSLAIVRPRLALAALILLAFPVAFLVFFRRGRVRVVERLAATDLTHGRTLPTRVHGVVLVSALDRPALRALTFARATRLTTLTAVTVDFDAEATRQLREAWRNAAIPVNLTVLGTPQGASTVNIVEYVRSLRALRPADIVMVFVPRVISTGMGQRFFVRHSTPRIISALRMETGVVISEVPFALEAGREKD
ncbi:APC family permease [Arcanobacterium haemolyticum]|nr:APC family permease [Arcanobacterium haemolyticum]